MIYKLEKVSMRVSACKDTYIKGLCSLLVRF